MFCLVYIGREYTVYKRTVTCESDPQSYHANQLIMKWLWVCEKYTIFSLNHLLFSFKFHLIVFFLTVGTWQQRNKILIFV